MNETKQRKSNVGKVLEENSGKKHDVSSLLRIQPSAKTNGIDPPMVPNNKHLPS